LSEQVEFRLFVRNFNSTSVKKLPLLDFALYSFCPNRLGYSMGVEISPQVHAVKQKSIS